MDNVSDKEINDLKQHLLFAEEILLKLCSSEKINFMLFNIKSLKIE
jgi:2-hydroxy-3-keto-5-methylthiopentenyl-1-phosphate phosphatase